MNSGDLGNNGESAYGQVLKTTERGYGGCGCLVTGRVVAERLGVARWG